MGITGLKNLEKDRPGCLDEELTVRTGKQNASQFLGNRCGIAGVVVKQNSNPPVMVLGIVWA